MTLKSVHIVDSFTTKKVAKWWSTLCILLVLIFILIDDNKRRGENDNNNNKKWRGEMNLDSLEVIDIFENYRRWREISIE